MTTTRFDRDRCRITVCRGCCCGTDKHPDVDHAAHLTALHRLQDNGHATVVVSGCLSNCERSNTLVVAPSAHGRDLGGATVWFGRILSPEAIAALTAWVEAGGPGRADKPAMLARHRQPRPTALTPTGLRA